MKVIILAGGEGARLFPLSRTNHPKQFISIKGESSLLTDTVTRFSKIVEPKDILIITNSKYVFFVKEELKKCAAEEAIIISEPSPRNTAPAVSLAVKYCVDVLGVNEEEEIFVAPSDHIIYGEKEFTDLFSNIKENIGKGNIVTLGISPTKPMTGYGYIKVPEKGDRVHKVEKFIEKPDIETATSFFNEGKYLWNSGMFAFSVKTFAEELSKHSPELFNAFNTKKYSEFLEKFEDLENISIDYAIAEKSNRIVTIPTGLNWNDVGSWDALYDFMDKDNDGNITIGDCKTVNCKNSLFMSNKRLVTGVGVEDTIVVETDDVIMISKKGHSEELKGLFSEIHDREEAHNHTTKYKEWGYTTILSQGPGYKVKKMCVYPGRKLSAQLHKYRSEHWVVIKGSATIRIGESTQKTVNENESIFVPKDTRHQLKNKGDEILEIIEVQNGEYLGEDDIIRFDDIYGV